MPRLRAIIEVTVDEDDEDTTEKEIKQEIADLLFVSSRDFEIREVFVFDTED